MAAYPSTTTAVSTEAVVARSQANQPFMIEKTFDLDTLLSAKIANADIINLFTLPANHVILATRIKIMVANVGAGGTSTLKLRFGTTDISATADMLTVNTVAVGGNATVLLPLGVGTSDVLVNLVAAVGSGTTTTNPTVLVKMLVCDMS